MFFKNLTIPQRLTLSFIIVILLGSFLLSLPIMHQPGVSTTYLDHLFTTVSMVCVTGLTVLTVGDVYNTLGQIICIILIQIGGLGLVTILAASSIYLKRRLSLREQYTLQQSFSHAHNIALKPFLMSIYQFTFMVEGIAALLISLVFVPKYGFFKGVFNAIFVSISAFCNAGFDNLGNISLMGYSSHWLVNLVVSFLIISGGIGFIIWYELLLFAKRYFSQNKRSRTLNLKKLSSHARLVFVSTFVILTTGTLLTWITEWGNTKTIANYHFFEQGLISFFQSVTMRTAGFATIDYTQTRPITNLLYMLQMVIGGAPGGTAGGIKITTAAIVFLLFKAELSGQTSMVFQRRAIRENVLRQTIAVLVFFFTIFMIGWGLLLWTQNHIDAFSLLFETMSALATVGVTMNVTAQLNIVGRIIIMCLMFIGRVGPATVLLSISLKAKKKIRYATTDVYLG